MNEYRGIKPILGSEPVFIPNTNQCRLNHGLVTAVPSEDITLGVFRRSGYKTRLKSLQKKQMEAEKIKKQLQDKKYKMPIYRIRSQLNLYDLETLCENVYVNFNQTHGIWIVHLMGYEQNIDRIMLN